MLTTANTTAQRFVASAFGLRATSLTLAAGVTFATLAGVGQIADHQHHSAESEWLMAQADTAPVQVIVINGRRAAKA